MVSQSIFGGSAGQRFVEFGFLLGLAILCIYLWRRYRQTGSPCVSVPCCRPVCCPRTTSCSGCRSCGIYTPHISPPRPPRRRCEAYASDPCAKKGCSEDPCAKDPCKASGGPIARLLGIPDLARRSVRFYLGGTPKDKCKDKCTTGFMPDTSCKKTRKDTSFLFGGPSMPSCLKASCSNACYRCGTKCPEESTTLNERTSYEITITNGVMSAPSKAKVKCG